MKDNLSRRSILSLTGALGVAKVTGDREEEFATWAIVELFGHTKYAGYVQEGEVAGKGFLRLDVPDTQTKKGWSKIIGTDAVYSITPVEESYARRCAESLCAEPVSIYLPEFGNTEHIRQLRLLNEPEDTDDDGVPF